MRLISRNSPPDCEDLSDRHKFILEAGADVKINQLADLLGTSPANIKKMINQINRRLGTDNRFEATFVAAKRDLISIETAIENTKKE